MNKEKIYVFYTSMLPCTVKITARTIIESKNKLKEIGIMDARFTRIKSIKV